MGEAERTCHIDTTVGVEGIDPLVGAVLHRNVAASIARVGKYRSEYGHRHGEGHDGDVESANAP